MKKTGYILIFVILSLAVVSGWQKVKGPLDRPGMIFHDFLQVALPAKSSGQVALILVDDATLKSFADNLKIYFPYKRELYGEILESARILGAKAVGFDIVFSEPAMTGPGDDEAFSSAIAKAPFPVVVVSPEGQAPTEILEKTKNLTWGHTKTITPLDGVFRRLDMNGQTFVSKFGAGSHSGWIHFATPDSIEKVSLYDVAQALYDDEVKSKLMPKLNQRVWIVAYSAPGLLDVKPSPVDSKGSGALLPANLISEYLTGSGGIKEISVVGYALITLALILIWLGIIIVLDPQTPWVLIVIGTTVAVFIPFVLSVLAWAHNNFWMDPIPLMSGLMIGVITHFMIKVRSDWHERRNFAKAIQHSMSPQMLKLIENGEVEVRRFGEKREIFVMFSDLVGFTTMSEQLSPEMLVELMNSYLDEAVELIINQSGYVDKFIGDAIMAIWGAPIRTDEPLHVNADAALKVAIKFYEVVSKCQSTWERQHGVKLSLGVRTGIHYGEAVVGNFGSHSRFNYTALGDTVNIASRLEGVGKYYNQMITVSGEVLEKASAEISKMFFCVDEIVVKGRERPTKIYTALTDVTAEAVTAYKEGFDLYVAGNWSDAVKQFEKAELAGIGAGKTLRKRCEALKIGQDITKFENGVWRLDEK